MNQQYYFDYCCSKQVSDDDDIYIYTTLKKWNDTNSMTKIKARINTSKVHQGYV